MVEGLGVPIYEQTRAESIEPGLVRTNRGAVRADAVLRCTEAFTVQLPGQSRTYIPVYSLMVATEPLPSSFWEKAGFEDRPTFNDARRLIIYGQRTADGRLAFGGRGRALSLRLAARPFLRTATCGSRCGLPGFSGISSPNLADAAITHRWGGAVAVPRDWQPSVSFDQSDRDGPRRRIRRRRGRRLQPRRADPGRSGAREGRPNSPGFPGSVIGRRPWEPEPLQVDRSQCRHAAGAGDRPEGGEVRSSLTVLGGALKVLTGR